MVQAVAFAIGINLVLRDQHAGVFCEVDATLIAIAAMKLYVRAGRALIAQGRMAAAAEGIRVTRFDATLWTLHNAILPAGYNGRRSCDPPHT